MARHAVSFLLSLVIASFAWGTAYAAGPAAPGEARSPQIVAPKPVQEAPQQQAPANGITQALFNAGAITCAPQINRVSNFLTEGTQAGAYLFVPPKEVDRNLVSVSLEIQAQGAPVTYASATFSPGTAVGCAAMYEAVTYWPGSCPNVAAQIFKEATSVGALKQGISMLEISATARVFLVPAGQGCVSIKKEVLL